MRKIYFLIVILLFSAQMLAAQIVTISGKVVDNFGKPIVGAIVSASSSEPEIDQFCDEVSNGYSYSTILYFEFTPTKDKVARMDVILKEHDVTTDEGLDFSIVNSSNETIATKHLSKLEISSTGFTKVVFDDPIPITPNTTYKFYIKSTSTSDVYRLYQNYTTKHKIYNEWYSDSYIAETDAEGRYSYVVKSGWSGTLNVYNNEYDFDALTISNITENAYNQDFKPYIEEVYNISGKVSDKLGIALDNMIISASNIAPEIDQSYCDTYNRMYMLSEKSFEFTPTKNKVSKVDLIIIDASETNIDGVKVSIVNSSNKILGSSVLSRSEIVSQEYNSFVFDKPIPVTPNETYKIRISLVNKSDKYYVGYNIDTGKTLFREWYSDCYTVTTDNQGKYSYPVAKNWNGSLYVVDSEISFNTLSFNNVTSDITNQNFKSTSVAPEYDYDISISESGQFVVLKLNPEQYASWLQDDYGKNQKIVAKYTKAIYSRFKDSFDQICFVTNESELTAGFNYYGKSIIVKSEFEGIGNNKLNRCQFYGSDGKLQQLMHVPYRAAITGGPMLHEIAHLWANHCIATINEKGENVSGHWGFTGGSTKGQLGGFEQSSLTSEVVDGKVKYTIGKFGVSANGGNSMPYNELELYLMGMIPVEQVSNFSVFGNISDFKNNGDGTYSFYSTDERVYTPERIVSELGERVPNYKEAQHDFKVLYVVITQDNLTNTEITELDNQISNFCKIGDDGKVSLYNFYEATGGRGTYTTGDVHKEYKLGEQDDSNPVVASNFESVKVWGNKGFVYIENASGIVKIFDLNSRLLKSAKADKSRIEIPISKSGFYIVMVNGKCYKLVN